MRNVLQLPLYFPAIASTVRISPSHHSAIAPNCLAINASLGQIDEKKKLTFHPKNWCFVEIFLLFQGMFSGSIPS